jgi:hypothetical protein
MDSEPESDADEAWDNQYCAFHQLIPAQYFCYVVPKYSPSISSHYKALSFPYSNMVA